MLDAKLSVANVPSHLRNKQLSKNSEDIFKILIESLPKAKAIFLYGKPSLEKEIFATQLIIHFARIGYQCLYTLANELIEMKILPKVIAIMHLEILRSEYIAKLKEIMLRCLNEGGTLIIDCIDDNKFKNIFGEELFDYLASIGIGAKIESERQPMSVIG